ncbi:hypothetical protein EDD11_008382 [Mortierella claussenii]|nr:hypothetical protein EDD11_008382 [Mortierella claussenii]
MDLDMTKYVSLLKEAKAEQELGDLKSAYATYLQAHAIIMHILGTHVVFKDNSALDSEPENYSQLLTHAQEILRRIKGIVDQTKLIATKRSTLTNSPSRAALSTSVSSRQPMSGTSLSPSSNGRQGLGSPYPSQRSIATTSTLNKRTKKNVPMIPISPLTRQQLLHSFTLSQVTQKFEQAKQGSSPQGNPSLSGSRDLASLRRLIEDVRIQRAKVDAVNAQIHSVTASTITSWDPDVVARQLTIIDLSLFKKVAIPRDLVRADRKASPAQHCVDFETYIAHSIAHLLLMEWSASRQPSLSGSPTTSKSHAPTPVNAVSHLIKVAQILLNVYRNFNAFMAVMRALTSPEIKRMHKLWSGVNSKTKDTFKRLVAIYKAHDSTRGYNEAILQKLDAFQDVGKDAAVAIPWMRYHMDEVKSIINSYLTGHESSGGTSDVVLSAPGARKLSAVSALLMQCRTNESNAYDRQDVDDKPLHSGANAKQHREPIQVDGMKMPLAPVWDLISLGTGDVTLHHWILSRPFLTKQQLIDESLEIEPLFNGEELPCYEFGSDENDDTVSETGDVADDDTFEHVIAPEHDLESLPATPSPKPSERPSLARAPVSETEINDIMNELLNDDSSDSKGLFDDLDTDSDADSNQNEQQRIASRSPGRSRDVLDFLGIDPEDYSDSDQDEDHGGDIAHMSSTANKDKGKAVDNDDSAEVENLLARVKGLVQESRGYAGEIGSSQYVSEGADHQEQQDHEIQDKDQEEEMPNNSVRKFEPFLQGDEEDQLGVGSDLPPAMEGSPVNGVGSSMLSLEALRQQLQCIEQQVQPTLVLNATSDPVTSHVKRETDPSGATLVDKDVSLRALLQSEDERGVDRSKESISKASSLSPFSSTNALTPPIITQSTGPSSPTTTSSSLPATSPSTIGRGRRRKIHTDRSGTVDPPEEQFEGHTKHRTTLGFSPPKTSGTEPPLSGQGQKEQIYETTTTAAHSSVLGQSREPKADADTFDAFPLAPTDILTERTTTATTEDSSHAGVHDSQIDKGRQGALFEAETKLLQANLESTERTKQAAEKTIKTEDNTKESQQAPAVTISMALNSPEKDNTTHNLRSDEDNTELATERGQAASDKSPNGDGEPTENRAPRQRRRIAGGVVSVAGPPSMSSLLTKASTSSLSGAFKEELSAHQKKEHSANDHFPTQAVNHGGDDKYEPQELKSVLPTEGHQELVMDNTDENIVTKEMTSNEMDSASEEGNAAGSMVSAEAKAMAVGTFTSQSTDQEDQTK